MSRVEVKKTYKLFINGAFPRSESGRVFEVKNSKGQFIANPALASRKDLRDSVVAARAAFPKWSGSTAYLRGQIIYRIAEMLEGRKEQFEAELKSVGDKSKIDDVIDLIVWYAGWSDKLSALNGVTNPVSGPFYNFTIPEAQGVIAITADSLLGFVEAVGAAVTGGNTVVALVGGGTAVPVMTFAEIIATSDVPNGVINVLTGSIDELAPWAASHMDIDGMDISAVPTKKRAELIAVGSENLKRIHVFDKQQTPTRIIAFMEAKTVWHPIGV